MNVIGINGSPRNQWNTATLVARALEGAAALGAATHLYDPGSLPQRGRVWEGEVLCTAAMAVPSQGLFAANAAFQVGYESPSQFSREYGRLFGAPPLRDITKLRQLSAA